MSVEALELQEVIIYNKEEVTGDAERNRAVVMVASR
jgi:hypothetical protein